MENATCTANLPEAFNCTTVFNRNERRVLEVLADIIEREGIDFTNKDIQDAYALTMNNVPPHYVHRGTIVLHPNISTDEIQTIARDTITQVLHISKP